MCMLTRVSYDIVSMSVYERFSRRRTGSRRPEKPFLFYSFSSPAARFPRTTRARRSFSVDNPAYY